MSYAVRTYWSRWWIALGVCAAIFAVGYLAPRSGPYEGYSLVAVILTVLLGAAAAAWLVVSERSFKQVPRENSKRFSLFWGRSLVASFALGMVLLSAAAVYGFTLEAITGVDFSAPARNPWSSNAPTTFPQRIWIAISGLSALVLMVVALWFVIGGLFVLLMKIDRGSGKSAVVPARTVPPGWYAVPDGTGRVAWWDGQRWDEKTHPRSSE